MTHMKEKEDVYGYMERVERERVDTLMLMKIFTKNHKINGGMDILDRRRYLLMTLIRTASVII